MVDINSLGLGGIQATGAAVATLTQISCDPPRWVGGGDRSWGSAPGVGERGVKATGAAFATYTTTRIV